MIKYSVCELFDSGKKVLVKSTYEVGKNNWDEFMLKHGRYKEYVICTEDQMKYIKENKLRVIDDVREYLKKPNDSGYNNYVLGNSNLACFLNNINKPIDILKESVKNKYEITIHDVGSMQGIYRTDYITEEEFEKVYRPIKIAYKDVEWSVVV